MTIQFLRDFTPSRAIALLLGALVAGPAMATVDLRVEARPASAPIQVFISVTDINGNPVGGKAASDFTVTIGGDPIIIADGDLTLPPAEDPNQRVSVVFTMDYSPSVVAAAGDEMEQAVVDFINGMSDGDYAAIVKFNNTNVDRASVVAPFVVIDHGANNAALEAAARADYPGDGTNLLDALDVSLNHILTPPGPLPSGPKSIVLVSDGGEFDSVIEQSDVLALANANSIPIFTIGVADLSPPGFQVLLEALSGETGGEFFEAPTPDNIADAYATILVRLNNEYLLSIANGITDCAEHILEVTVTGEAPVSVPFTRRVCDTEPDPFTFTNQTGVAISSGVTSNTVTIIGLEVPADISTQIGTYSIGCNGTFTGTSGTISNGQTVCVQHTSSAAASTTNMTTLTIGGVSGTFTTTTRAAGGGGGGGGGGATGGLELLAGFALLFARRRRRV